MMSSIKIPRCLQMTFENSLRWFKKGFSEWEFLSIPQEHCDWTGLTHRQSIHLQKLPGAGKLERYIYIYIAFIIKIIKDLKHENFAIHSVFAQNKKNRIVFMENNMNGKTNVTYSILILWRGRATSKIVQSTSGATYLWIISSVQYEIWKYESSDFPSQKTVIPIVLVLV